MPDGSWLESSYQTPHCLSRLFTFISWFVWIMTGARPRGQFFTCVFFQQLCFCQLFPQIRYFSPWSSAPSIMPARLDGLPLVSSRRPPHCAARRVCCLLSLWGLNTSLKRHFSGGRSGPIASR